MERRLFLQAALAAPFIIRTSGLIMPVKPQLYTRTLLSLKDIYNLEGLEPGWQLLKVNKEVIYPSGKSVVFVHDVVARHVPKMAHGQLSLLLSQSETFSGYKRIAPKIPGATASLAEVI